nr:ARF17 [Lilium hybrid cultivar]
MPNLLTLERDIDPQVWRACAGTFAWIPATGSTVYYFPEGHAEQSSSMPDFSSIPHRSWFTLCRVAKVSLLASPDTDEVFAKLFLDPLRPGSPQLPPVSPPFVNDPYMFSYTKILTPEDVQSGGGFTVPMLCAVNIFPAIGLGTNKIISVHDVHGTTWEFLHTCRGTPSDHRHYLSRGWSNFVNTKKLVAGDSVVFICDQDKKIFVGIRRAEAGARVRPKAVVHAVRRAMMKQWFEVEYYPATRSQVFVVAAEIVEAAARVSWNIGMRMKMPMEIVEMDGRAWLTEFSGTVIGEAPSDPQWPDSQWRMLQVTWDKPKAFQLVNCVNPWQLSTFELFDYILINTYFPLTSLNTRMMGEITSSLFKYNTFLVEADKGHKIMDGMDT